MAVNAAPSGKAPPGRLRSRAATMALATAFPVAGCRSPADNSAGPAEYRCQVIDPGPTTAAFLTGTRFTREFVAIPHDAIVYVVPAAGAAAGGTGVAGAEVEEGDAAWVDTHARLVTTKGRD